MAKKIAVTASTSYFSSPCDRCGSPKIIGKVWKETVETFNGKSVMEHSQIVCSDRACQNDYNKSLIEEAKKKEALKLGREMASANRRTIIIDTKAISSKKAKN